MIILGTLFPEEREAEVISASKAGVSNAANSFQWKVIKGIQDNTSEKLVIFNILPVGIWPKYYSQFFLNSRSWNDPNIIGYEIGGLNIPVFKQFMRMIKIRRLIRDYQDENEILIFTAYLPFLYAVYKLPSNINVTAVITDIPEYYDMHQVSLVKRVVRKIHNRFVYHYMSRIDRYVLLTEQMKEPLHIDNKPYMIMEGICDIQPSNKEESSSLFSLLYSGRLNKRYGLSELMEAVEGINDPDIQLWICGSGEMEGIIKSASLLDKRIRYFGFLSHDETIKLQQKATVLINPRKNEGEYTKYSFPSKTMEYLAAGRPVMMYRLDGIPREYDPYLFYIPGDTIKDIQDAIVYMKSMPPDELTRIGKRGQEFVFSKKGRKSQAKRLLHFIHGDYNCE